MARLRTILSLQYLANEEARKNQQFDSWPSEAYDIRTYLLHGAESFLRS